jgi:GDPmannose 4,6-dehydratase
MKKKIALITGVTGQDGSYLTEFLLKKNYVVHGIRRRHSKPDLSNISNLINSTYYNKNFFLHYGDLTDSSSLNYIISKFKPDEIYNLAAQSHVHTSFVVPGYTAQANAIGCLNILLAMENYAPKAKFYQASTSELFGVTNSKYQNEKTIFNPQSPYSISKLYAHYLVKNYRSRGFFSCSGILFNHESPRRSSTFVTKKIIEGLVNIKNGKQSALILGNIYAKRDWGYAKEFVVAMWKILQQKIPRDYVISTGATISVKDFLNKALRQLGFKYKWSGKGVKEVCKDLETKKIIIKIDKFFFRPSEVNYLRGDSSKANVELKWKAKTKIDELIKIMINEEIKKSIKLI